MADEGEVAEIARSGLFDEAYYLKQSPEAQSAGALRHYCESGWLNGLWPNPFFDTGAYLRDHADVAAAAMNPLLHYLRHGEAEGRRPHAVFDPVWYRSAFAVPKDRTALGHFLAHIDSGHVLPSAEAFVWARLHQRRNNGSLRSLLAASTPDAGQEERRLIAASRLLDANYYLINGDDVLDSGLDPVTHYCVWGWRERRKPNIYFDTGWYLQTNPEVQRLGINPLAHYILDGERTGRRPVVWFDPVWYRQEYGLPDEEIALADYLEKRRSQSVSPNALFDVRRYVREYGDEIGPGRDPFAHYMHLGAQKDIPPSDKFDPAEYRRRFMGRPSRHFAHLHGSEQDNPLIHYLLRRYLQPAES